MIPQFDPGGHADLPPEATFWMPDRSELDDEEGIGYFRDVWTISDVPVSDARFNTTMWYIVSSKIIYSSKKFNRVETKFLIDLSTTMW